MTELVTRIEIKRMDFQEGNRMSPNVTIVCWNLQRRKNFYTVKVEVNRKRQSTSGEFQEDQEPGYFESISTRPAQEGLLRTKTS